MLQGNNKPTGVVLPDLVPPDSLLLVLGLVVKLDIPCPTTLSDRINFSLSSVLVLPLATNRK